MKRVNLRKKLGFDKLDELIYEANLVKDNHSVSNVLKIFLLRRDFPELLSSLKKGRKNKKNVWDISKKDFLLAKDYVDKLLGQKYFFGKSQSWKGEFSKTAFMILTWLYPSLWENESKGGDLSKDAAISGRVINYPGIETYFYDRSFFEGVFNKYLKDKSFDVSPIYPEDFLQGGKSLEKEKIFLIQISENVSKESLITYIENSWGQVKATLDHGRSSAVRRRNASSPNLLRDIEIYNKYLEFKEQGFKYLDRKVRDWFRSEKGQELEPNTIRKIVSDLESEIKEINCEN